MVQRNRNRDHWAWGSVPCFSASMQLLWELSVRKFGSPPVAFSGIQLVLVFLQLHKTSMMSVYLSNYDVVRSRRIILGKLR